MTFFLRDKNGDNLLDLDLMVKTEDDKSYVDIKTNVDIQNYSNFLVDNIQRKYRVIRIFNELSELEEWMWKVYFKKRKNTHEEYPVIREKVENKLKTVAEEFNLDFIID